MPDRTTIVVFTHESRGMILKQGGSRAWSLKAARARSSEYIVCTRNRSRVGEIPPEEQAAATEMHGAAFLVGKVTAVERAPDHEDRYIIRFDQYTLLPDRRKSDWPGHQNPIWYVKDIGELGIDPDNLNWHATPETAVGAPEITHTSTGPEGLTFDQARAGLATMYRVPRTSIEIVIRG
jgi:hypothetical protein